MKILITGGFGYLGGRLAQFIATHTNDEIILGTRTLVPPPVWLQKAKTIQTDWMSDESLLKTCSGIDLIIHLAGMNAQDSTKNPELAFEINAGATNRLLRAAIQNNVKRFIYLSTAHVYGSHLAGEITEKTQTLNNHIYATSHLAGEANLLKAHSKGEIDGVVIRLSNSFGAPMDKKVNCWSLLVNDLCMQALINQQMKLLTTGNQRRDFISLTDACRAIYHLSQISKPLLGDGLFNVGGQWSPTVLEMANLVASKVHLITGNTIKVYRKENQEIENSNPLNYQITKLKKTGFELSLPSQHELEIDNLIKFCLKIKEEF